MIINNDKNNNMSKHGTTCILCNKEILTADIKLSKVLILHLDGLHLCCKKCFTNHINDYDMITLYGLNCPKCMKKMNVQEYVNAVPLQ